MALAFIIVNRKHFILSRWGNLCVTLSSCYISTQKEWCILNRLLKNIQPKYLCTSLHLNDSKQLFLPKRIIQWVWSNFLLIFCFSLVSSRSLYLPRLLYPTRISFRYEGEFKSFTDKQKLREFSTTKPALQQMLKDLL